jgi:hypothetical protein
LPSPATKLSARTVQLKSEYSWSINSAIEAGRPALASELADSFHADLADLARAHDAMDPMTNPRGIVYPR